MCFSSIYYLFKNVPPYYTRQVSHQLQKHTSDVQSDLAPRGLQARHNWAKQKAVLALSEHFSLSNGSAAPLSNGHRDAFALKMLT